MGDSWFIKSVFTQNRETWDCKCDESAQETVEHGLIPDLGINDLSLQAQSNQEFTVNCLIKRSKIDQ